MMGEFFVVRAAHRQRVGHEAALELFRLHPDRWEIHFQEQNPGRSLLASGSGGLCREYVARGPPAGPQAPSRRPRGPPVSMPWHCYGQACRQAVRWEAVRWEGDGMLESSDLVAFTAASDLPRARAFYEHTLGLPVVEHNDFACVFDAHGTMLRVTAVSKVARAGYTVLGWRVSDIEAAIRDLTAKGVVFTRYEGMDQDDNGIWTTPGGEKVAWFADPDGNTLSLTQFRS
jgi:catechol 2,3-dioxygenase-like lactoylglutathione lyase family enzyme